MSFTASLSSPIIFKTVFILFVLCISFFVPLVSMVVAVSFKPTMSIMFFEFRASATASLSLPSCTLSKLFSLSFTSILLRSVFAVKMSVSTPSFASIGLAALYVKVSS